MIEHGGWLWKIGIRNSRKNIQVLIPEVLQVLKGTPCKPSTEEIAFGKHANPIALELEFLKMARSAHSASPRNGNALVQPAAETVGRSDLYGTRG